MATWQKHPNAERYAGKYRCDEHKDRKPDHTWSIAAPHAPCAVGQFLVRGGTVPLFADSNVGKSILAVQIADRIARTDNVLLSGLWTVRKAVSSSAIPTRESHPFPKTGLPGVYWLQPVLDADLKGRSSAALNRWLQTGCKDFIIDNLTYLAVPWRKAMRQDGWWYSSTISKKRYGFPSLFLAHTPKRFGLSHHINDLAGSKRLYNFFDSVFCHREKRRTEGLRYVKTAQSPLWDILPWCRQCDSSTRLRKRMPSCNSCSGLFNRKGTPEGKTWQWINQRDYPNILQLSQPGSQSGDSPHR